MSKRVVISSLTGKPIAWDEDDDGDTDGDGERKDRKKPIEVDPHDAQLLRDLPPHWGRGN